MTQPIITVVCEKCGGPNVQEKRWVRINTNEVYGTCETDDYWCEDCDDHVGVCNSDEWVDPESIPATPIILVLDLHKYTDFDDGRVFLGELEGKTLTIEELGWKKLMTKNGALEYYTLAQFVAAYNDDNMFDEDEGYFIAYAFLKGDNV